MAKWQTGDDFSAGGKFLDQTGTYHFCITAMDENPQKKDGSLIDNAFFRAHLTALAGTVDGQKDQTVDLCFFYPKPSSKDQGAFATKQIDRFFLSTGIINENLKGQEVDIDLQAAVGRQIIAKLELDQDGKHLRLAYADVFHVDDPAVSAIPKDENALKLLPASQRMIGGKKPAAKPAPQPPMQSQSLDGLDL